MNFLLSSSLSWRRRLGLCSSIPANVQALASHLFFIFENWVEFVLPTKEISHRVHLAGGYEVVTTNQLQIQMVVNMRCK